jgi:hypothetical protein
MAEDLVPSDDVDCDELQHVKVEIALAIREDGNFEIRSIATDDLHEQSFCAAIVQDQDLEMVLGALVANRIRLATRRTRMPPTNHQNRRLRISAGRDQI